MTGLDEFAALARAFTEWCDAPPAAEAADARRALELLARLYAGALRLDFPDDIDPDPALDAPSLASDEWDRVFARAGALPFNFYHEVMTPDIQADADPAVGDLADDVADIYRDLHGGLRLLDDGHPDEARWEFVFTFRCHWGRHATSAMHVLHDWLARTDNL